MLRCTLFFYAQSSLFCFHVLETSFLGFYRVLERIMVLHFAFVWCIS